MAGEVTDGEHVLPAMADGHNVDSCSRTDAVVVVKQAMALASRSYGNDQPREREVGEALMVAGDGRA